MIKTVLLPVLVALLCGLPAFLIGLIFACKKNESKAWYWGNRSGWWITNNNGWFVALLFTTVLTFGITCQKFWTQPSLLVWDSRQVLSDPNKRGAKIFNLLLNELKGDQVSDPNGDGNLVWGNKNYPPLRVDPPNGNRPDYHIWLARFLFYLLCRPFLAVYSSSDEVGEWIEEWKKKNKEKEKNEKKKEKDSGKSEPESMLKLGGLVLISDILAKTILRIWRERNFL